jgi:hypothetical protein
MTDSIQKISTRAMWRLIAIGVVFAFAITFGVSRANASTPGQVGDAPRCTVDAVGARGSAFHPSGDKTTVKFKITGTSNCKVQLSANSFYAPSMNGKPYSKQILYQRVTKVFKRGTYSMTVGIPTTSTPAKGCYYQVDLTYGIHNLTPLIAYGHGKIANCGQPPQPTPQLVCQSLTFGVVTDKDNTYQFTAKATVSNTTITKYDFNFGDGKTQTVTTSATTAQATHTYAEAGKTYTATVAVSSKDKSNVTSANCKVTVTTPETPKTPTLVCENLTFTAVSGQANTYTFTAAGSANDTTITNYVFDFGDGNSDTVTTANTTATTQHTYADSNKEYRATVTVNGKDVQNVTSPTCAVTVSANAKPQPPAKTPVLGATTELPNTGAGDVFGFFAATAAAGGLIHRYLLRRKLSV